MLAVDGQPVQTVKDLRERMRQIEQTKPPRVVFFDQFEEIFTAHFERWQDREGFFEQITDALKGGPFTLRRSDIRRPAALLSRRA